MYLTLTSACALCRSRTKIRVATCLGLIVALYVGTSACVYGQATFTPLGLFGGTGSVATDVSADGSVVVGTVFGVPGGSGSVFHRTATESMLRQASVSHDAAVSGDRAVVVGSNLFLGSGIQAFRWIIGGPVERLEGFPQEPPLLTSSATDVSADGDVIVGFGTPITGPDRAFRWTETSGMVDLGNLPLGPADNRAFGVSADGTVIVGSAAGIGRRNAFRWTNETGMVPLPELSGAIGSQANKVSTDGSVIVGVNDVPPSGPFSSGDVAVRWTEQQGVMSLGTLPLATDSAAFAVSADGSVVVGRSTGFVGNMGVGGAFYWTEATGMLNLQDVLLSLGADNLDAWSLSEARGVSTDGLTIVGWGDHNGRMEAFMATVPEPSTVVLAILAAGTLLIFWHLATAPRSFVMCRSKRKEEAMTTLRTSVPTRRAFVRRGFGALAGIGMAVLMPLGRERRTGATSGRVTRANPHLADVTHFGAVGDGKTDDTAAFQAAVESLKNTRGLIRFRSRRHT